MWEGIQTGQLVHIVDNCWLLLAAIGCWLSTSDFDFDFWLIVNDRNGMEGLDCDIDAQWVDSGRADVV